MLDIFRSPRRLLLFLFEGAILAITVGISYAIRTGIHAGLTQTHLGKRALLFAAVQLGALYYSGMYDATVPASPRAIYERVLKASILGTVVLLVVYFVLPAFEIGRGAYLVSLALTALLLPTWRVAYDRVSGSQQFRRRTIIVGNGPLAREIAKMIEGQPQMGLELVGMLSRDQEQGGSARVIGTYDQLFELTGTLNIDYVIVAYPDRRGTLPVEQLLEIKFRGIEVEEGVQFYERTLGKIYVRELKPSQLIFAEGFTSRATTRRLKRILDVVVSLIGLTLASPLILLTMIAIKLESPGPVLYKQVRAGEHGKLFTILKFRSMRTDAEKHGAQFAQENDPRVTRVGKFIRKTRLDELPQLWNVLKGEMSMVGPRPERPVFIEQLEQQVPFFKQRLYVKPGVTGHAQVRCRYGADAEDMLDKLQYDLYYIKSYSLLFDLSVMMDTVKVVLLRIGAR